MFLNYLQSIIDRDLLQLQQELSMYQNEDHLWKVLPGTGNSGGNLVLHVTGNLRHFIGHVLGGSGYQRNRDAEFSATGISIQDLTKLLDQCRKEVKTALGKVSAEQLANEFPVVIKGIDPNTTFVLIHLSAHLNYHLGQLNYHRRIISALESEL